MDAPLPAAVSNEPLTGLTLGSKNGLTRAQRVLLLLGAVWVLHSFDLKFTLAESSENHFIELNPIAAQLLDYHDFAVIAYKVGLLGFGTLILAALRRHTAAEIACWFLLSASFYVGARWFAYYEALATGIENQLLLGP